MSAADNLALLANKVNATGFVELFGLSADVFTTAGTTSWTCPAGVTRAKVTVIGGGGNGGSGGSSGAGGGGGAGGCAVKWFSNLVPGTVYSLTVGAQGAASSFVGPGGVTPTGNGGSNGGSPTSGGAGGAATGGDLNLAGEGGTSGIWVSGTGAISGKGGSSVLGGGARGLAVTSGQVAGAAGGAPGAGGSGSGGTTGTASSGGAGQPGAVIIEY